MGSEDIEQLLENARFKHLSEATLVSYRDKQLDKIGLALADAHLKLCLICDRKLTFLKGEAEARESYELTEEDHAANEQFVRGLKKKKDFRPDLQKEIERFNPYILGLQNAWVHRYSPEAVRGSKKGNVKWRYKSKDGVLKAWLVLETDHSLTVHFSASDLKWEGIRIRFRLGPFRKVVTLEREGDLTVAAKVKIPRRSLAKKMDDVSIEVL
ncbi:MAG TPA: hypothetical protein VFI24_26010 [Pyrinomonadaceae bacterium]|nr:hypothetical protein [Pyrinomonadaceae bacterium]